jgi:hypothetical protein
MSACDVQRTASKIFTYYMNKYIKECSELLRKYCISYKLYI